MTAITVILALSLMFFFFTYNKSRIAYNKAFKANEIAKIANLDAIQANKNLLEAQVNLINAKEAIIESLIEEFAILSQKYIKQKIDILEIQNPNLIVSPDFFYKLEDLLLSLKSNSIDVVTYLHKVENLFKDIS